MAGTRRVRTISDSRGNRAFRRLYYSDSAGRPEEGTKRAKASAPTSRAGGTLVVSRNSADRATAIRWGGVLSCETAGGICEKRSSIPPRHFAAGLFQQLPHLVGVLALRGG